MIRRLAALLLLALAGCAHPGDPDDEWVSLFDGKTLQGWTPKISGHALGDDPFGTFRAEGGAIRVSYDRYPDGFRKRFGHLAYRAPFSAYRLRLEYRMVGRPLADVEPWQQSNSGVMIRGQPPPTIGRDQSVKTGVPSTSLQ